MSSHLERYSRRRLAGKGAALAKVRASSCKGFCQFGVHMLVFQALGTSRCIQWLSQLLDMVYKSMVFDMVVHGALGICSSLRFNGALTRLLSSSALFFALLPRYAENVFSKFVILRWRRRRKRLRWREVSEGYPRTSVSWISRRTEQRAKLD